MLPVIAIVGRPNVGKSTLFNKLTKSRAALISAFPGTTRDRQFGRAAIDGRHFIVIDTGGILEEKESIDELITKQALLAIEDANQIIFVIDGREGITPADYKIADLLRKSGKSVTLAVNKAENLNILDAQSESFSLGIGKPIFISALQGSNLTELVTTLLPEPADIELNQVSQYKGIKLAIVGRPNAGKSTLTNRMLGEERVIVSEIPGTTRDSIYIPLERYDQHYVLIDTAGVRKRKHIVEVPEKFSVVKTLQAIEDANVILYVIDGRANLAEQDLKLLGFILESGKGLVIAVNKWDNMTLEDREAIKKSIDRQLDFVNFARVHYISALHGSGVGNLFESVTESYNAANKKLSTPTLTRLLEQAQLTHSPPLVNGRRVKLRYAHAGGHNPPRIVIHGNQLKALPESYKRFLAKFYQRKLNLHGTPVFIEFKTSHNPYQSKK